MGLPFALRGGLASAGWWWRVSADESGDGQGHLHRGGDCYGEAAALASPTSVNVPITLQRRRHGAVLCMESLGINMLKKSK